MLSAIALCVVVSATQQQATLEERNVYVGTYLSDVSDFALKEGHFKADLRVWVKWRGEPVVPEITFENLAELDSKDEMGFEHDGAWHSAQWRVQGTFRGDFPVHSFPFDTQTLPVVIGLEDTDGILIPDLGASGMSPQFSITGWSYEPFFQARTDVKKFGSDLGSIPHEGKSARLRRATFLVEMHRPFGPYLLKFALPLALILLMALLALFLPGDRIDVRSAMGVTALLACIAFHYTQADTLPDVTYLVAADKLFLGAYVFITGTFLCSVASFRISLRDPASAQKLDRFGIWALPVVALLNAGMLVADALESTYRAPPPMVEPKPSQPLLRVASANVDSVHAPGGPSRRTQLVVRGSDGIMRPAIVEEAPAMTNSMVRLLPDGGMIVRWRLRQGAKWSDGRKISTKDLEYSINVGHDPLRKRIVAVDDRTVDVTYSERHGEYLNGLTIFPANDKPIGDGGADALNRLVNGKELASAAPYLTGDLVKGQKLTLVRNETYAGPRPVFEKVELLQKTPEEAAAALLAKELDVISSLTPDSYELLKGKPGVRIFEQPGEQLWVLMPNLNSPPWDSLEARRALLNAIDRDGLVKELAPMPARVASGWRDLPRKKVPASDFSLNGLTVRLHMGPQRSKSATNAIILEKLRADLAKAGVTLEVEEHEQLWQFAQKDFDGLILLGRSTDEPSRFMGAKFIEGRYRLDLVNAEHFDRAMVDEYERYVSTLYDERRDQLETVLQHMWFDRLPVLPLVLTSRLAAVREELSGPDWGNADSIWWNVDQWSLSQ